MEHTFYANPHRYQHTITHHIDDTAFNAGNKQQVQQYIIPEGI
jgi:hypothetical protein